MEIKIQLRNGETLKTEIEESDLSNFGLKNRAGWIPTKDFALKEEDILFVRKLSE